MGLPFNNISILSIPLSSSAKILKMIFAPSSACSTKSTVSIGPSKSSSLTTIVAEASNISPDIVSALIVNVNSPVFDVSKTY